MSTPIPLPPAALSGTPGTAQSAAAAKPLEMEPGGLEFIEMLVATLGGGTDGIQPQQVGGQPSFELPSAGEEGKILPPAMLPVPFSPFAPAPEPAETGAAPPVQPGVTRGVPASIVMASLQNPVTAKTPEPELMPAQLPVEPVGDPETIPLQPVAPARAQLLPVTPRGAEGLELPSGTLLAAPPPAAGSGGAASAAERPSLPVTVQLHSPQWQNALGERMVWMVKRDLQQAELRLNPQHLGPVEVRIEIRNEQASITFSAHHAVTRDALEAAVPRLREMLGDNGVNLASVDISRQHSGSGQGQQRGGEDGQRQDRSVLPEDVAQISDGSPDGGRVLYGGVGLVDLFA